MPRLERVLLAKRRTFAVGGAAGSSGGRILQVQLSSVLLWFCR